VKLDGQEQENLTKMDVRSYSGRQDDKHQEGVAMVLRQDAMRSTIGYDPVNSRIMKASFRTRCGKATIQVYAPTANSTEVEVEEFHTDLQSVMNSASKCRSHHCDGKLLCQSGNRLENVEWCNWEV